jgi:hypothetical protein
MNLLWWIGGMLTVALFASLKIMTEGKRDGRARDHQAGRAVALVAALYLITLTLITLLR